MTDRDDLETLADALSERSDELCRNAALDPVFMLECAVKLRRIAARLQPARVQAGWDDDAESAIELLGEAYGFASTSPRAQEAINFALDVLERRPAAAPAPDHIEQVLDMVAAPSPGDSLSLHGAAGRSVSRPSGSLRGGEAVAWIRFRSDGGWEGPIHNCQIDDLRRNSGVWTPLGVIAHPAPGAQAEDRYGVHEIGGLSKWIEAPFGVVRHRDEVLVAHCTHRDSAEKLVAALNGQPHMVMPMDEAIRVSNEILQRVHAPPAAGQSEGVEALVDDDDDEPMSLAVAFDFADNPRPYHSLMCPADTNGELYEALSVLAAEARRLASQPASAGKGVGDV